MLQSWLLPNPSSSPRFQVFFEALKSTTCLQVISVFKKARRCLWKSSIPNSDQVSFVEWIWMVDISRRKVAFVRKIQLQNFEAYRIRISECCNGRQGKLKQCFWMLARCANPRGNLTASNRKKLFVGRRAASFGISEQIVEISINWFALIPLLWGNLEDRTLRCCIPSATVSTYPKVSEQILEIGMWESLYFEDTRMYGCYDTACIPSGQS